MWDSRGQRGNGQHLQCSFPNSSSLKLDRATCLSTALDRSEDIGVKIPAEESCSNYVGLHTCADTQVWGYGVTTGKSLRKSLMKQLSDMKNPAAVFSETYQSLEYSIYIYSRSLFAWEMFMLWVYRHIRYISKQLLIMNHKKLKSVLRETCNFSILEHGCMHLDVLMNVHKHRGG